MRSKFSLFVIALLLSASTVVAQDYVPDELEGWQQWVLKDKEYLGCPFHFDRNTPDRSNFLCAWPGRLQLDVTATGGRFTQQWTLRAENQWIELPGSVEHWPDRVTVNDRAVEVIARENAPGVYLAPGTYRVSGRFEWDERPGVLRVPPQSGLLSLTVDGRPVARPDLNRNGVFLGERKRDTRAVDSVRTVIYRLVADDIPTRLVTMLRIDVSGAVREELFGPILPEGFVPTGLQSQLPAKLEADGNLRLQVRPGRWVIQLSARAPEVTNAIPGPVAGTNLPGSEIWSYQSNDRLRVTAAEGLPPVDPAQVEVPGNWQSFPAYRVDAGATFEISERSRGVVSASNELRLDRTMWLGFDGKSFLVEDDVSGEMRTDWRLDMGGPYTLLAAEEDGEALLITDGSIEGQRGVEVRQTDVALNVLGRSDTRGSMPVTGWQARFADVDTTLNLPPGHKLLTAPGVDSAFGSWANQWQLLDFFLVLIITIAMWRLFSPTAGVIALFALTLSFHEMFAPNWLWLNLLIAVALLRVAPKGWLRRIVRSYQLLSVAALVIVLVPFIAGQLRIAIYPQLEPQHQGRIFGLFDDAGMAASREADPALYEADRARRPSMAVTPESMPVEPQFFEEIVVLSKSSTERVEFSRYAPNAIVQAGPGVPTWSWNNYTLHWSGPVDAEQEMRLIILPSWLVSALRFVEVGLLLLFAGIIAAEIANRRWSLPGGFTLGRSQAAGALIVFLGGSLLAVSAPADAQMPDAELLRQLEQRLLEPPDCLPRCAEIAAADVSVGAATISMELDIHAMEDVAIPLPGSAQGWRPDAVLVDGAGNVRVLRMADGSFWLYVRPGRHRVDLRGPVPAVDSLEVPFPAPARVINVNSDGWFVAGVKDRRLLAGSLQLTRLQTDDSGDAVRWESSRFPPFARIERTVELDLDWRVRTTVHRVAPAQGALTLDVPLIDGETIVSGDFTVTDGHVLVSMDPQQQEVSWVSNLPRQSPLTLTSVKGSPWKETWRFAVGNIWNAAFSGLPESNSGGSYSDVRVAEFDPRRGEQLTLTATRPEASAGSTLAFDSVALTATQGNRSSDVGLLLRYRSTRGAQHVIQLPDDAEITTVEIDGIEQTLRAEEGELTLPILPGEHSVSVTWRAEGEMGFSTSTPVVDLGAPAGNIELSQQLPADRWLIGTLGPRLGPAVLYWPELAALIIFALLLGRTGLAPLNSWQWLLLGLGFSTFNWQVLAVVAIWLLACGARERIASEDLNWWRFNVLQVIIGGITVIALLSVITALPQGLLGTPDMHVTGHHSYGSTLSWFADRSESVLPIASAFTVPMWIYKILILSWALWLSFALLRWLPWVWQKFSSDGFWRSRKDDMT
jgi:hypothetical protein